MNKDHGASADADRALAVPAEPVSAVSALRASIPSALYLLWASQGEYSDRSEWAIAIYTDEAAAQADVERGQALFRKLFGRGRYLGYDAEKALWETPDGRALSGIVGDECGTWDELYLTCAPVEVRTASGIAARSDETPQAAQPEGQEPGPKGDAQ